MKDIRLEFVKDITNFSLYNNWQLQLTIKNTNISYGRHPHYFKDDLIDLLNRMKTDTVSKIICKCDENIELLNSIDF